MTRALKIIAAVIGLLILTAAVAIGSAFIGRQSIADGFEVDGVRIVKDGINSAGVVSVGPREVALVDATNDSSGKAILAELSRRQLGADAVVAIFVTHGHPDHIAAIPVFRRAQVVALDREAPLIEGREGARGPLPRLMPVRPTGVTVGRRLRDGETVMVGSTLFQAFAVPGHTAGSAAYLVNGVLFMGDAADLNGDWKIVGAPWIFSDSQSEDRASIVRLAHVLQQSGAAVKVIACAHSGVRTEGLAPLMAFAQQ